MHRRVFPFLIVAALAGISFSLAHTSAQAQSQPELRALQISLWPEYDRPSMLVIYRITLSPESTLPANLTFRIPSDAEVLVVAVGADPTTVDEVRHSERVAEPWKEVSFTATFPVIQFEYYDTGLRVEGQSRHYDYHWPGDYVVGSAAIEVQQPVGATEMRISPDLGQGQANSEGVVYYTSQVGSLPAGQGLDISVDYKKSNTTLTIEELNVQPSQPVTADTPGRIQLRSALPWVLGFLGVVLIFGGGLWYWQSGRKEERPQRRKRSRGERLADIEQASDGIVYCHQCGKRAAQGDRFCRSCGTKLRAE